MKISQLSTLSQPTGNEYAVILDPNEQNVANRVKRVLLSAIMGSSGADGADGLSAYQIWLQTHSGTSTDFLNSLKGAAGDSAYATWLATGHTGSPSDFIAFLIGPQGKSLYQVWLDAGHTGTESQFLATVTGPAGANGQNGSIFYSDTTDPLTGTGINGDYFINTTTGNLFKKTAGAWGSSLFSLKGANGALWKAAGGVPSSGLGVVNDMYLDINNGNVYGPKTLSGWGSIVGNIKGATGNAGAQGIQGSLILTGTAAPNVANGRDGDFYLRTTTGELFGPKTSGVWGNTPAITLATGSYSLAYKDDLNQTYFHRSLDEGFAIKASGDASVTFNTVDRYLEISSQTSWSTLQSKPTDIAGFGITDAYTKTEVDGFFGAFAFADLQGIPSTVSGYGLTDVYTKSEVDTAISNGLNSLTNPLEYVGTWDASTNTPTLSDTDTGVGGHMYRVTVAGAIDFGSGAILFNVTDKVVNNGTNWERWETSEEVTSVNGLAGDVVLNSDAVAEGSNNKYYTDFRVQGVIANVVGVTDEITLSYNSGSNALTADLRNLSIANERLINDSITIAGTEVELGDAVDLDTILGISTAGYVYRTGANTYAARSLDTILGLSTSGLVQRTGVDTYSVTDVDTILGLAATGVVQRTGANTYSTSDLDTLLGISAVGYVRRTAANTYGVQTLDQILGLTDNGIVRRTGADSYETVDFDTTIGLADAGIVTRTGANTYAATDIDTILGVSGVGFLKRTDPNTYEVDSLDNVLGITDNGLVKRTTDNTYAHAVAGTDYAAPTNGTSGQVLTSDGAGGFGTPIDPATLTRKQVITMICGDDSLPITTGIKKKMRMPYAFTLAYIRADLLTPQASGSDFTVDVKVNGVSAFTTLIVIDNTLDSSFASTTQSVLTTTPLVLADNDKIEVEVTQVGDGTATGLTVALVGHS